MVSHSKIDWGIVVVILEEPLIDRISFELKECNDVLVYTLGVIWHIPDLIEICSNMSEIIDLECRCLVNSPLSHNTWMRLRVVDTLANSNIMENTKRERKRHVKVETRISWLWDLWVSDRVLVNRIVFNGVFNVRMNVRLREFPIGDKMRIIIRVIPVHSELFILHLLEAMEFCEKLELFHETGERLGLNIIIGTEIYRVRELWVRFYWLRVVVPCLYDTTHVRRGHCQDLFVHLSISTEIGSHRDSYVVPIVNLYYSIGLIVDGLHIVCYIIRGTNFEYKWDLIDLSDLLRVDIYSVKSI